MQSDIKAVVDEAIRSVHTSGIRAAIEGAVRGIQTDAIERAVERAVLSTLENNGIAEGENNYKSRYKTSRNRLNNEQE